jgi:hypothetical protein
MRPKIRAVAMGITGLSQFVLHGDAKTYKLQRGGALKIVQRRYNQVAAAKFNTPVGYEKS